VHTFLVTLKTKGSQSLTATDTVTASITGAESGITVNAATAISLVVSGFPSPISVTQPGTVTVTAQDAYGNIATGYQGTVHFSSSDAAATLPANYAFVAADAGVHSFNATLSTVGTQSLTASDVATGTIAGQQTGISVKQTWAHPELITISFVPDGTLMTTGVNGNVYSNTFAKFNAKWSTLTWQAAILTAAQTWAQQANVNFDVVSDNGTTSGQGSYQQGDPGMGDIRIGGYGFGNNYLAGAYLPPPTNNYSIAGDFDFNTAQSLNIGSTYDIQTVALHELGHSLGSGHTTLSTAVMYPSYHGITRALTSTDIATIQAIYGARQPDAYNTNPATANASFATAASLNSLITNQTAVVNNLSISSTSQSEYFAFTAPATAGSTLTVTAQSAGLSMFTPSVTVYAANQSTVLGSASSSVQYHGVTVSVPVGGVTAGQQFYVKVSGVDSSSFSTGAYALTLNFGSGAAPSVQLPNTKVLNGAVLQGGGGLALGSVVDSVTGIVSTVLTDFVPTMDFMAPSEDLIPPCCLGHGGGCGCPACKSAASQAMPANTLDPQKQQEIESGWTRWEKQEQSTVVPALDGWIWAAQKEHKSAPTPGDQASMLPWREACDACFVQQERLEAFL
jgi:hypothetical protein